MIGQRLRHLRDARNDSREIVAEYMGVSAQQIWRWETDRNDPTGDMISKLAKYFDVTTDYLLGLTDDPSTSITEDDLNEVERRLIFALRQGLLVEALQTFADISSDFVHPTPTHKPTGEGEVFAEGE